MTQPNEYIAGQIVEVSAAIVNDAGSAIDPTALTFKYSVTLLNATIPYSTGSFAYSGSSTPGPNVLARLSLGTFEAQVDTTSLPGIWIYEFVSTGFGQGAQTGTFVVNPLPL